MLRNIILLSFFLISNTYAEHTDYFNTPRMGLFGELSTDRSHGTSMGGGLGVYAESYEIGSTASGYVENTQNATRLFSLVLYGGLRKAIIDGTYFAAGINFLQNFGKEGGLSVDREYEIGPYISLEQMLTYNILLGGWILPYQYDYEKLAGSPRKEHEIFTSGGIKMSYFF